MGNIHTDDTTKFENIQLKFLNNKKSANHICSQCDIRDTCKACPGMMYSQSGILNEPILLLCKYYIGIRDGILEGIMESSKDENVWKKLIEGINSSHIPIVKACE